MSEYVSITYIYSKYGPYDVHNHQDTKKTLYCRCYSQQAFPHIRLLLLSQLPILIFRSFRRVLVHSHLQ
jgi:hypothetical protein